MKYTIDTDVCESHNISVEAALYLLTLYLNKPVTQETIKEVWKMGGILVHKTLPNGDIAEVSVEKTGIDIIDSILSESMAPEVEGDRFDLLAPKLIELYPKGKKEGTAYMWRDSKSIISKRLRALVRKYKVDFTDEQAIDATRRYVQSFNGNYRYMQLLKYFISKKTVVDGTIEESSQLLSYIENEEQENNNEDWTSTLVN